MGIRFCNPGPEDVTATIPCGPTFAPEDADDQRLMVLQPASIVVPASGHAMAQAEAEVYGWLERCEIPSP